MRRSLFAFSLTVTVCLAAAVPAAAETFLCFGDSITFGLTGTENDSYLGALRQYLVAEDESVVMINAGLVGEETVEGLARLSALLPSSSADTVLIMQGTNDVQTWAISAAIAAAQTLTRDSLAAMVDAVQAAGKRAIIATVPPRLGDPGQDIVIGLTDVLNAMIRSLAAEKGIAYAEVNGAITPIAGVLTYRDSIHPHPVAEPVMAEAFAAAIKGLPLEAVDLTGPLPIDISPFPGTTDAPIDTAVAITLRELRSTVDVASIVMLIDGVQVQPDIVPIAAGIAQFVHRFPNGLAFNRLVAVDFRVADTSAPANETSFGFTFQTTGGNGTGGDINGSGRVDGQDLAIVAIAFGSFFGEVRYNFAADVDANGRVDGLDMAVVIASFGGPA